MAEAEGGKADVSTKPPVPTEDQEQRVVVDYLRLCGVLFAHVPNGGYRTKAQAGIFKALGVSRGCPDLLVFEPVQGYIGVAIELKRQKPAQSRVSDAQKEWLERLSNRGWYTEVCYGAEAAIATLQRLGIVPGGSWD